MRVGIGTALVLSSSIEAAVAQGVQDDPRRRRLVLPSVREATDCIARETLNEPGIEGATRPGQLRAALAQPMRRCADEVDAMIAAHDQVYYPGYGEAFFQGAYLQDLVRAIQRRIGPELARRALEAAERAPAAQQPNPGLRIGTKCVGAEGLAELGINVDETRVRDAIGQTEANTVYLDLVSTRPHPRLTATALSRYSRSGCMVDTETLSRIRALPGHFAGV